MSSALSFLINSLVVLILTIIPLSNKHEYNLLFQIIMALLTVAKNPPTLFQHTSVIEQVLARFCNKLTPTYANNSSSCNTQNCRIGLQWLFSKLRHITSLAGINLSYAHRQRGCIVSRLWRIFSNKISNLVMRLIAAIIYSQFLIPCSVQQA